VTHTKPHEQTSFLGVLGQLIFQRTNPILQTPQRLVLLLHHGHPFSMLSNHLHNQGHDSFFALNIGLVDIFQRPYPQRFHDPIVADSAI
jgi:hypothetical protein